MVYPIDLVEKIEGKLEMKKLEENIRFCLSFYMRIIVIIDLILQLAKNLLFKSSKVLEGKNNIFNADVIHSSVDKLEY